jgi:hypothetical protein
MQQDAAAGRSMPSKPAAGQLPGHAPERHHDLVAPARALQTWIRSRDVEAIAGASMAAHSNIARPSRSGLKRSVLGGLTGAPGTTTNADGASRVAPDALPKGLFTLVMSPRVLGVASVLLLIVMGWAVARSSATVSPQPIQVAGVGSLPPSVDVPVAPASPPTVLPEGPGPARADISGGLAGFPVIHTTSLDVIEALLLTRAESWLQTTVDGGEPRERLLPPGRTITFEGKHEVTLRIGNAAAVSLWINGQPARPLGREGQVVTLRITRETAQGLLLAPVS